MMFFLGGEGDQRKVERRRTTMEIEKLLVQDLQKQKKTVLYRK